MEELKAKMERSSRALDELRARAERDQSGREDQYPFGVALAATEYGIHQRAGRAAEAARRNFNRSAGDRWRRRWRLRKARRCASWRSIATRRANISPRSKSHYGANHPEYRKRRRPRSTRWKAAIEATRRQIVARRVNRVSGKRSGARHGGHAVSEAKAEFDQMNARSFEYQALKREADADKNAV